MTVLRTALLGYGLAGRVIHRPLLVAEPRMQITHVVTADPERQAQAAADLPGVRVVPDAGALWAEAGEFDSVIIATPNRSHVPLARPALALGKPTVVDKPLANGPAEAAALAAEAERLGVLLSVFHNRRWDSDTLAAASLLTAGTLGTVHRLESRFTRFRPQVAARWREQPGGGVLLDLGSHVVDQALHLLGAVIDVYAEVRSLRAGALVDDDCFLALTHASGARSHLWCSMSTPVAGPRLTLQGSLAGWSKVELDGQEDAQRSGLTVTEPAGQVVDAAGTRPVPSPPGAWGEFYRLFAAAVLDGGPAPVPAAEAVRVLEVLDAAATSSMQHQVVRLPD